MELAKDPKYLGATIFKSPAHVVRYLGHYTHRVAISNSRILSFDGQSVSFAWKDYKDGGKSKV